MCLMLYLGTATELPLSDSPDLRIERVGDAGRGVTQWFASPVVQFVGAHTGCSCGFPSVIADSPIEYYEGMPLDSDDRAADLRSVCALLELLGRAAAIGQPVELTPWLTAMSRSRQRASSSGSSGRSPRRHFFFNEGFMHVVWSRVRT
jgi:hypothetical protein